MSSVMVLPSKMNEGDAFESNYPPKLYTYQLNGLIHTLSDEERQAGERVGYQTYDQYAQAATVYKEGNGGWEFFDQRPGKTQRQSLKEDGQFSLAEDQAIIYLYRQGHMWEIIAGQLNRSIGAVSRRWTRIRNFYL
jgi:hypothetical protein